MYWVAVFDVIRKFGNNWIKSMEEGGMCFDYRLETLGGWKVGKGERGRRGEGDLEFPWDARQGKGGYKGGEEKWN